MYTNSPYKEIPIELLNDYTLNDKIPILNWWRNDSKNENINWNNDLINNFINRFTPININLNIIGREDYPNASRLLLEAFEKYNIKNMNVAVVGSLTPWIEAILINLNNNVTTIEYNVPNCKYEKIICKNYFKDFQNTHNLYDCIVSFSSIEHSGLGRYGDPLDPNGDLKTMENIYNNIKDNGILIWGGPIGQDALVWNVHRVYGNIRLPLLFKNFIELEWFGFNKDQLLSRKLENNGSQPVIVLKKVTAIS